MIRPESSLHKMQDLGITLLILGSSFFFLARLLANVAPRLLPKNQEMQLLNFSSGLPSHNSAILLVEQGGRVGFSNSLAQEWFGLNESDIHLENLVRRTAPGETFLGLCAQEGQAHFSLNGQLVQGFSYSIHTSSASAMVVTLQRVLLPANASDQAAAIAGEAGTTTLPWRAHFEVLAQMNEALAANLDLNAVIEILLESIEQLIPTDFAEITIWNAKEDRFVAYRLSGSPDVRRHAEEAKERYSLDNGYSGYLVMQAAPLLIPDVEKFQALHQDAEHPRSSLRSYLGTPLLLAGERVGTIELRSISSNAFTTADRDLLEYVGSLAAIALHNALLTRQKQRRAKELAGLAHLAALGNTYADQENLITRLVQAINPLMELEILGFLLFDESRRLLQGQLPFLGLPDEFVDLYQTSILEGSPAEKVWSEPEPVHAHEAAEDPRLQALGLADHAIAAGIRETVLVPLIASHKKLGYLQAANKPDGASFDRDDLDFLSIIAGQAATAIESARIFAETRRITEDFERRVEERTAQLAREHQRTATLLQIITELSASLDLEQVLNRTLKVLNEVAQAEEISCLVRGAVETEFRQVAHLNANGFHRDVPTFKGDDAGGLAVWVLEHRKPVLVDDCREDYRCSHLAWSDWPYRSAMGIPLVAGEELVGVLLLFHSQAAHFSEDQLELVSATGHQIAVTLNNAELYSLIRDQAEDLGNLLRSQEIEANRSRAILESMAEGVLVTDATNQITLFNASAEKILDLNRTRVVGRSLDHFTGLFGRATRSWMRTIQAWSSDPLSYHAGESYGERINLEGGRVVAVQLAPVFIQHEFFGTVSIFHDITHQVEVDRLKTEFVATVSHELRTPMTSIKGYVDLLLMGAAGGLNEQQVNFLQIVQENSQRLAVLVNDLLDISRIEANRIVLALQPLELGSIADQTLSEIQQRSKKDEKPIEFINQINGDIPRVYADPDRVRQILASLLDNAYQYTPESGQITLRALHLRNEIQVDVIDSGVGIPAEEQEHVFERFFRGENPLVLETAGTGLGLSIVQHLVGMHQGRIWLESAGIPGKGSTFSFTLPLYNPKASSP